MVLQVFQISDIHIGGEYGGKFDCWGNFEKALDDIVKRYSDYGHAGMALFGEMFPQSVLVLSGDICDKDAGAATVENYTKVRDLIASKKFFQHVVVFPGNHDDAELIGKVFVFNPDNCRLLMTDNANLVFIPTHKGTVNVKEIVGDIVESLSGIDPSHKGSQTLIFSHFPIGPLHHRFMGNGHSLEHGEALAKALEYIGVSDTFCGHYHSGGSFYVNPNYRIHVSPSTQMQLNPYAKNCDTISDYPGYQVIELVDEHSVKVEQVYLDEPAENA